VRICHVDIERFLCFKTLSLDVNTQLQLVAGPNNAGKSSLVRLLEAFFGDPDGAMLMPLLPAHDYYRELGPRTLSSIQIWFAELDQDERDACTRALRRDGQIWLSLRCSRTGTISYEASRKIRGEDARRLYEYVLSRHHVVKIPSVRVGSAGDADRPASLERLVDTLEAVLIRRGATRSTALQQEFARRAGHVEEIVRNVLDESAQAIHGELPFQEGEVSFRLQSFRYALRGMLEAASIESSSDVTVPVAQRGTGFQSALVIGILRYVARQEAQNAGTVIFAIEEPEAFLHPQTQRAMARIMRQIADDAQVLVTTHASVIVDSFDITRIARLPLQAGGTEHSWRRPELDDVTEGQLSRYCSAANSELVFANAVIFVEGEGDHSVVEDLLSRICQSPGGHYARGVTVVEAAGLGKIKHLVALAEMFGVRSFVIADKDGLRRRGGQRVLLQVLSTRHSPPPDAVRQQVRALADRSCTTLRQALGVQREINRELRPYGAFVMSSDLEGLLLDIYGTEGLIEALGPEGEGVITDQFARELAAADDARERLASWIGSKGWNGDAKTSGKLEPHLPRLLMERWFEDGQETPRALRPLERWLTEIVKDASPAPL
jgi:putative ATP-dependent endonuclease of OLD family